MNLYVHFPFCRAKCAYCALLSRAGADDAARRAYVAARVDEIAALPPGTVFRTVYFGGGTPSLCALEPFRDALAPRLAPDAEWTVELHPCDVTAARLASLRALGVNRVSLGIQSFDDAVLRDMGRGHTAAQAVEAFRRAQEAFPNAGFDLIAGWPRARDAACTDAWRRTLDAAGALAPVHCSVYTLIREEKTRLDLDVRRGRVILPSDDEALAELTAAREALAACGLARYEISNFAKPGFECRHNAAVWAGEDYVGLGEGACGREGLVRTRGVCGGAVTRENGARARGAVTRENGARARGAVTRENGARAGGTVVRENGARDGGAVTYERTSVTPEADAVERTIFALRTARGLDLAAAMQRFPVLRERRADWQAALDRFVAEGVLTAASGAYRLTARGTEICDTVLAELV